MSQNPTQWRRGTAGRVAVETGKGRAPLPLLPWHGQQSDGVASGPQTDCIAYCGPNGCEEDRGAKGGSGAGTREGEGGEGGVAAGERGAVHAARSAHRKGLVRFMRFFVIDGAPKISHVHVRMCGVVERAPTSHPHTRTAGRHPREIKRLRVRIVGCVSEVLLNFGRTSCVVAIIAEAIV